MTASDVVCLTACLLAWLPLTLYLFHFFSVPFVSLSAFVSVCPCIININSIVLFILCVFLFLYGHVSHIT